MPLFATHSAACWFFTKTRACVEETALLSLPLIYKGANFAVMADMNYDGLTIIFIDCRPSLVSTGASGHFFFV